MAPNCSLNARQSMRKMLKETVKSSPLELGTSTQSASRAALEESLVFARVGALQTATSTLSHLDGRDEEMTMNQKRDVRIESERDGSEKAR